jgi:outer membrane protein assembly factor BamD (BamD/ComL family)
MGARIKTTLVVSVLLSILSFCISQNNATAKDFLKKLIKSLPTKNGKQLKAEGDYPSAITAFTKSIKKEPENLEAYYQLGLIFEEVMHKFDKAVSMYKKVITLSEGVKPTGNEEESKKFNTLIENAKESIDRAIKKKFESIEKPTAPVYITVKPNKKVIKEPKKFSYSFYQTSNIINEFRLFDFQDDWYQINIVSVGMGWISGKDVIKIIQKGKETTETSLSGKAAQYKRFVDLYPDSHLATDARERAHNTHYELAKKQNSISGYSVYLENYPNSGHTKEFRLKKDELTFQDDRFLNNIERLKAWIENNPESTFLDKAKIRLEELMFAQAKHDRNVESLERYIAKYHQGRFIADAKQIIEDIKYEQAQHTDTIDSFKKYLDEYPNGKYIEDAIKRIDERKFIALLKSEDIELLSDHVKSETNQKRIQLVKNRIDELYFKKADNTNNEVDAIKMHEKYLQKYPNGLYVEKAKAGIEDLSFNISAKTNTIDSFYAFTKKYPQSQYYQKAIDSVEILEFNNAKDENTVESYQKFLKTHPNGKLSQTARNITGGLVFGSVKKTGTVAAYDKFIKKYPKSEYTEEAKLKIDQLNYEHYRKKDSIKAYKKFVKKHPENRYVNDARQKISQRTVINKPRKRNLGFSIVKTVFVIFVILFLARLIVRLKTDEKEKPYHVKETDLTEEPVAKLNPSVKVVYAKSCPNCNNITVSNKRSCIWCGKYIPKS